jgi:pimeloyl-ACP methyl ester carboxylesterase
MTEPNTYDPRGAGRSPRTDGALATAVDEHADDPHRLISAVGEGPADIFASSGGAVNALALVHRAGQPGGPDPGRLRGPARA